METSRLGSDFDQAAYYDASEPAWSATVEPSATVRTYGIFNTAVALVLLAGCVALMTPLL